MASLAILVAGLTLASNIGKSRPPMPGDWTKLRAGMSRDQVLTILQGEVVDMRELKGYEVTYCDTTMLGFPSYWHLLVSYDSSDNLSKAEARFTHRKFGFLSTEPMLILSKE